MDITFDSKFSRRVLFCGAACAVFALFVFASPSVVSAQTSTGAPYVSRISPTSGAIGTQVTVTGSGFLTAGGNFVKFGQGVIIGSPSSNGTSFTFTIPRYMVSSCFLLSPTNTSCPSAPISVTASSFSNYAVSVVNLQGQSSNIATFFVTSASSVSTAFSISSLSPSSGATGALVTVRGSGFTGLNGIVFGNGIVASAIPPNNTTTLSFNVPYTVNPPCRFLNPPCVASAATISVGTYNVYVVNGNGQPSNILPFTVTSVSTPPAPAPAPTSSYLTGGPKFSIGDRVEVMTGSTLGLHVRASSSISASIIGTEMDGSFGTIIGGPVSSGSYTWWRVKYDDGITGWSAEDFLFTPQIVNLVLPPPPPPPPPPPAPISVSFNVPQNGATVSGNVAVSIAASSLNQITSVSLYKDNNVFVGTLQAPPYIFTWDSAKEFNGPHTLKAVAYTAGSSASASILVTVTGGIFPPPTASISANPASVAMNGISQISWSSTNATNCSGSGTNGLAAPSGGPWTTPPLIASTTYQVICTGPGGTSTPATVTVNIIAPVTPPPTVRPPAPITVYFTNPTNGATVAGNVNVRVAAISTDPITSVSLYKDNNVFIGNTQVAPYSFIWDVTKEYNGGHSLKAFAFTASSSASIVISVTVSGGLVPVGPPPPPVPTAKFLNGSRVTVNTGSSVGLNVRSSPTIFAGLLGTEVNGSMGTVIGGPVASDNYTWWQIKYDDGITGWSVEDWLY
ncbi:MAG: Ig-like domain-containing protein [Candidatus Liptonbacteria bacterium]|nr:Ig-like domain-containing protein [Candidatus Liptonbacteria bacterium]